MRKDSHLNGHLVRTLASFEPLLHGIRMYIPFQFYKPSSTELPACTADTSNVTVAYDHGLPLLMVAVLVSIIMVCLG